MHSIPHDFSNRKISPWGGIKLFHQLYQKTGLREFMQELDLPRPGSNRGYCAEDLIEGFMVSVVLGARRLAHSGMLRTDEVIKEIFGWEKGMASASTFSRFFGKYDLERNNDIFPKIMRQWFKQQSIKKMTIDIDSTVITRYGLQELSEKGYNPKKKGARSHHPLLAFCSELSMVVNAWQRSGDSGDATDACDFLDEMFEIVSRDRVGLVRMDRGFYSDAIMSKFESSVDASKVNYILKARMTSRLVEHILNLEDWYRVSGEDCVEFNELEYVGSQWAKPRRITVSRQKKKEEQKDEQGLIFEADKDLARYEYRAYATNTDLSSEQVELLYNKRADCENRIKELKYDYGMDGYALKSFTAMEAAFRFVMVAYNIMSLFRNQVMKTNKNIRLSNIKFQCIAIGSYLVKSGRNKKLMLAVKDRKRHFLEHFFDNIEQISPPFQFSNA